MEWKIKNLKRSSSIQTEREKIYWATKKTMDILKPEQTIGVISEERSEKINWSKNSSQL